MRDFIYYSSKAVTTGKFDDLAEAGRMDIACHTVIQAFFLSRARRQEVHLHLFFYGRPDPPKHLEIWSDVNGELTGVNKKDVIKVIKRLLNKYKAGEKKEVDPGCFVEKKSLLAFVDELQAQGRPVYVLDEKGEDLRTIEIGENPVFILGDHEGVGRQELKRLRKTATPVSVGPASYFASQVIAVVHNELDRRNL